MLNEAALLGNPLGTKLGEACRVCLSDVWGWCGMAHRALCSLTAHSPASVHFAVSICVHATLLPVVASDSMLHGWSA